MDINKKNTTIFKQLADSHLAMYMKDAQKKGVDPEKSVLGMLLSITIQLEHKHGKRKAHDILSGFINKHCVANA